MTEIVKSIIHPKHAIVIVNFGPPSADYLFVICDLVFVILRRQSFK
jgi:hypothetical protein